MLVYGVMPPGGLGEEFRSQSRALSELGQTATGHAVELARAAGVETVVELVQAKPADALVEVADKHGAAVIVVGSWGESPLKGAILGSTPNRLLHISTRPVLCVPAPAGSTGWIAPYPGRHVHRRHRAPTTRPLRAPAS